MVPTLRPLLAVTGPPRQYGPKPCSAWPLAGLQRPRPVLETAQIEPFRASPRSRSADMDNLAILPRKVNQAEQDRWDGIAGQVS
jgi:hypothetical protein